MIRPFYWQQMSKKLRERLDRLSFVGFFTLERAEEANMRLVEARSGKLAFYWLVDETDGVIADVKFQAYGPIGLLAAAEIASELSLHKTYDQASRLSADLIDQHMRDHKEIPAFPKDCAPYLNQVLSAIDEGVEQCLDIPFAATYDTTPIEADFGEIPGGIPGWLELAHNQKVRVIEEVLAKEIRPYIELDAGGVKFISLEESGEVVILYEGSCTTCHSSTGSTLTAIQRILKARVHPSLFVTPKLSST